VEPGRIFAGGGESNERSLKAFVRGNFTAGQQLKAVSVVFLTQTY
jgi:hypothetical protein